MADPPIPVVPGPTVIWSELEPSRLQHAPPRKRSNATKHATGESSNGLATASQIKDDTSPKGTTVRVLTRPQDPCKRLASG